MCQAACVDGFGRADSRLNGRYLSTQLDDTGTLYWFLSLSRRLRQLQGGERLLNGVALTRSDDFRWEFREVESGGAMRSVAVSSSRGRASDLLPEDDYYLTEAGEHDVRFMCCNSENFVWQERQTNHNYAAQSVDDNSKSDPAMQNFLMVVIVILVVFLLIAVGIWAYRSIYRGSKPRKSRRPDILFERKTEPPQYAVEEVRSSSAVQRDGPVAYVQRLADNATSEQLVPVGCEPVAKAEVGSGTPVSAVQARVPDQQVAMVQSPLAVSQSRRAADKPVLAAHAQRTPEKHSQLGRDSPQAADGEAPFVVPALPSQDEIQKDLMKAHVARSPFREPVNQRSARQMPSSPSRAGGPVRVGGHVQANHQRAPPEIVVPGGVVDALANYGEGAALEVDAAGMDAALGGRAAPSLNYGRYEGPCAQWAPSTPGAAAFVENDQNHLRRLGIQEGDEVRLTGFTTEGTWNGAEGVLDEYDSSTGRCIIRLHDGREKEVPVQNVEPKSRRIIRPSSSPQAGAAAAPQANGSPSKRLSAQEAASMKPSVAKLAIESGKEPPLTATQPPPAARFKTATQAALAVRSILESRRVAEAQQQADHPQQRQRRR